jgi:glycosyltransferase involved in cell wall biosynthesis
MKILHISQPTVGGTLEFLRLLLPRLNEKGFQNEVACPSEGPLHQVMAGLQIPAHTVEMGRQIAPRQDIRSLRAISRVLDRVRPAIVHVHNSKAGVLGRIAAGWRRIPCIYTPHGWPFAMHARISAKLLYASIERACAPLTDLAINISDSDAALARRFRVLPQRKMRTIFNGIDPTLLSVETARSMRAQLNIADSAIVVGMVARLTASKDPVTFVQAAQRILCDLPQARFVLVGDGELRTEVDHEILRLGLGDHFTVTGWTTRVAEYLSSFDIAVMTSAWEGFGLAVVEYMAARRPVVATRVGGIRDIVREGVDGLLVEPRNPNAVAAAVLKVHHDRALAMRLVENAAETVNARFHIDRVAEQYASAYEAVAAGRS